LIGLCERLPVKLAMAAISSDDMLANLVTELGTIAVVTVAALVQDAKVEGLVRDRAVGQSDLHLRAAARTSRIADKQRRRNAPGPLP
jgi:hypothetical protein